MNRPLSRAQRIMLENIRDGKPAADRASRRGWGLTWKSLKRLGLVEVTVRPGTEVRDIKITFDGRIALADHRRRKGD